MSMGPPPPIKSSKPTAVDMHGPALNKVPAKITVPTSGIKGKLMFILKRERVKQDLQLQIRISGLTEANCVFRIRPTPHQRDT
jgi:hypothetical protein